MEGKSPRQVFEKLRLKHGAMSDKIVCVDVWLLYTLSRDQSFSRYASKFVGRTLVDALLSFLQELCPGDANDLSMCFGYCEERR